MENRRSIQLRRAAARLGAVALLIGFLLGLLVPRIFAADVSHSGAVRVHVISKGENLWSLASIYDRGSDPRRFVHDVRVLNGLESSQIFPGQRLVLPTR